jgi:hypothetical protein
MDTIFAVNASGRSDPACTANNHFWGRALRDRAVSGAARRILVNPRRALPNFPNRLIMSSNYHGPQTCHGAQGGVHEMEALRLEAVVTCVGFGDILDITLALNHPHVDHLIVVTSHDDRETQAVARKHSATCVQSDLFRKNGRNFNKGAAINAGMDCFQYHGWRLHFDADIIFPDNFRRLLFNHTHLDRRFLYGADRVDVIGLEEVMTMREAAMRLPQHAFHSGLSPHHGGAVFQRAPSSSSARYVDSLRGYCPIGFFQLWHASQQRPYPYSLGTAAHDDVIFAGSWPREHRHLLPSVVCYHLCGRPPYYGENWDGQRRQPRIK